MNSVAAGLSLTQTLFVIAAVVVGALIQGSIGFGFSFLIVPVLGLLRPDALPVTLLFMALPMTIWMALRGRGSIEDVRGLMQVIAGRALGTIGGVWLLVVVPPSSLSVLIGAFIVIASLLSLAAPRIEVGETARVAAGVVSGVMGTAAALGGPAAALAFQRRSGDELRATLAALFVIGNVISLTGLSIAGEVEGWHILLAIQLLPAMAAGLLLSRLTVSRLDRYWLRPAVLAFAAASGVAAVIDGLS